MSPRFIPSSHHPISNSSPSSISSRFTPNSPSSTKNNHQTYTMATAMKYHPKAQADFQIPLLAGDNAFLGDVFSSDKTNPEKPISAGLFRLKKGEPLTYTYKYDEMKIILEGDYTISDETGQSVTATKGDVFYFPAGATITFTTTDYGLAFYVGQRKESDF